MYLIVEVPVSIEIILPTAFEVPPEKVLSTTNEPPASDVKVIDLVELSVVAEATVVPPKLNGSLTNVILL